MNTAALNQKERDCLNTFLDENLIETDDFYGHFEVGETYYARMPAVWFVVECLHVYTKSGSRSWKFLEAEDFRIYIPRPFMACRRTNQLVTDKKRKELSEKFEALLNQFYQETEARKEFCNGR